jgi:hypothetical protein
MRFPCHPVDIGGKADALSFRLIQTRSLAPGNDGVIRLPDPCAFRKSSPLATGK